MVNVSFQKQLESNKYIVSGKNAKDFKIKSLQIQMKILLWFS